MILTQSMTKARDLNHNCHRLLLVDFVISCHTMGDARSWNSRLGRCNLHYLSKLSGKNVKEIMNNVT